MKYVIRNLNSENETLHLNIDGDKIIDAQHTIGIKATTIQTERISDVLGNIKEYDILYSINHPDGSLKDIKLLTKKDLIKPKPEHKSIAKIMFAYRI